MDSSYQVVSTVSASNPVGVDLHEFRLTSDNTALITMYPPKFIDGMWVLDSCFEEVPVDPSEDRAPFSWCASDHIDLNENPTREEFLRAGKGRTPDLAWDYVHINSVEKSPGGDYLVSARHLDSILLISRGDGAIRWRLGGDKTSFELQGFAFAQQHDARIVSSDDGSSTMTISLFNNGNDGVAIKNKPSSGLVVQLDLVGMTARQLSSYGSIPQTSSIGSGQGHISSNAMGNLQLLPGGHMLANFGRDGAVAEYPPEGGDPVFLANLLAPSSPSLPSSSTLSWRGSNYRTALHATTSFTGAPVRPPSLWTYARTPTNLMTSYVSWNGDTRTSQYKLHVSDSSSPTPPDDSAFNYAGVWPRTGFETNFTIGSARPWSFAEALDADGMSLANSSKVRTYIPAEVDRKACGKWHCFPDIMRDEDLIPLGEVWDVVFGSGVKSESRVPLGVASVMEHVFALVGLGLCAWWVWGRLARGWRDARGYEPVSKEECEIII